MVVRSRFFNVLLCCILSLVLAVPVSLGSYGIQADVAYATEDDVGGGVPATEATDEDIAVSAVEGEAVETLGNGAEDVPRYDYLPTDDYKNIFNLKTYEPEAFTSASDPLEDFVPYTPTELYLATMNKHDKQKGEFFVMDTPLAASASSLKISGAMDQNLASNTVKFPTFEKERYEYQTQNVTPLDMNGDGVHDYILQSVLYTGTKNSALDGKKTSIQQLLLYQVAEDGTITEKYGMDINLANGDTDDRKAVDKIEAQKSLGLRAMTSGDFDGDGKQEAAVYVPSLKVEDDHSPYILILGIDEANAGFIEKQKIKLSDLEAENGQFSNEFDSWYLPIVHLATTQIAGRDDLVINVSLPLEKDYYGRAQEARMGIYSTQGGSTLKKVLCTSLDGSSSGDRMRFAQAIDSDLNGNGVNELVIGAFKNHSYDSSGKKSVGSLDSKYNLMNIIVWENGQYKLVWDKAKEVEALRFDKMNLDVAMQEPAALTSGRYKTGNNSDGVFLEGVVLYYQGAAVSDSEFTAYQQGNFAADKKMEPAGDNHAFINQAISGRFAMNNLGTEQIVIVSGDDYGANADLIYFDISWIWEADPANGTLTHAVTDNDYMHRVNEDDNGTFITLCPLNIDKDTLYFEYQGKSTGWSSPAPVTINYSAPYWEELPYNPETFGKGKTSYSVFSGKSSGHEDYSEVGGGAFVGLEALFGPSFLGNGMLLGFDFNMSGVRKAIDATLNMESHKSTFTVNTAAGKDQVLYTAVPITVYEYKVWVPDFTASQAYLDEYKKMTGNDLAIDGKTIKAGDIVKGDFHDFTTSIQSPAIFQAAYIDEYNEMVDTANTRDGVQLEKIDVDKIYPHRVGDPLTYPDAVTSIPGVTKDNGTIIYVTDESDIQSITPIEATYELSFEEQTETEKTDGVKADLSVGLAAKAQMDVSFGAGFSGSAEAGASFDYGWESKDINTKMNGSSFSVELAGLPKDCEAYGYYAGMAVWQTTMAGVDTEDENKPYAIGCFIPGSTDDAPAKLPQNFRVSDAGTNALVLKWDEPAYDEFLGKQRGEPATYKISRWALNQSGNPVNTAEFTVDASIDHLIDTGLDEAAQYYYTIQSVHTVGSDPVKTVESIASPVISGVTLDSKSAPSITTQPKSVVINPAPEGTATFTVVADPVEGGGNLLYQWQKNVKGAWTDLAGQTGSSYTIDVSAGDLTLNETDYRVMVTQFINGAYRSTYSNSATLYIGNYTLADIGVSIVYSDESAVTLFDGQYYAAADASLKIVASQLDDDVTLTGGIVEFLAVDASDGEKAFEDDKTVTDGFPVTSGEWASAEDRIGTYRVVAIYNNAGTLTYSSPAYINIGQLNPDESYFRIEYELNGGVNSSENPKVATLKSTPFTLADATKRGAQFAGWIDSDGKSVKDVDPATFTEESITYTAQWENDVFALDYELDGGTNNEGNPANYTIDSGDIALLDPTKTGYAFKGWYLDEEHTKPIETIPAGSLPEDIVAGSTDSLTLYAEWEAITYSISYRLLGGDNDVANPSNYTVESAFTFAQGSHPHPGKLFEGWYADSTYSSQAVAGIAEGTTGDIVLWAKWKAPEGFDPGLEQTDDGIFLVSDAKDLVNVARAIDLEPETYASASYRIAAPIDFGDLPWVLPIGTATAPFQGIFDGNDMPIHGLDLTRDSTLYDSDAEDPGHGLFGIIGALGQVKNVTLLDVTSQYSPLNAGALAAVNRGLIQNCSSGIYHSNGSIMKDGKLELASTLKSTITAQDAAGGLVGINSGIMVACSNAAEVSASGDFASAGGLAGINRFDGVIVVASNRGAVFGKLNAGGMVGLNQGDAIITCGYNAGDVSGTAIGGIAGSSETLQ